MFGSIPLVLNVHPVESSYYSNNSHRSPTTRIMEQGRSYCERRARFRPKPRAGRFPMVGDRRHTPPSAHLSLNESSVALFERAVLPLPAQEVRAYSSPDFRAHAGCTVHAASLSSSSIPLRQQTLKLETTGNNHILKARLGCIYEKERREQAQKTVSERWHFL